MLTKEQLIQLKPLTANPRYGKLLSDAIEIWKREDVCPVSNGWGVLRRDETFVFMDVCNENKCCLIGAALIDKKYMDGNPVSNSQVAGASVNFNVSQHEIIEIIRGFDGNGVFYLNYNLANMFGVVVKEIVQPRKYWE